MSRKIATPTAVFEACEQLDAANKPWNRDDVRLAVGGGGYNVIDPLIKAWRKLKPVKALASSTPTELLYQVAEALEVRFSQHISDVELRENERTRVFESTITEISELMHSVEAELEQAKVSNLELNQECLSLRGEIEENRDSLDKNERVLQKLQAENDELRGFTQRLKKQSDTAEQQHNLDIKSLENKHENNISSLLQAHKLEISKEKMELIERNAQAENRLMLLIDQERTEAKKLIKEGSKELVIVSKREQDSKEKSIELKIKNQGLSDRVNGLLLEKEKLSTSLADAESRYEELQQEFQLFQENSESSKFEELRATLLTLQENLRPKPAN